MNDNISDNITLLKQHLAKQDAPILAPEAKLDKLRRMNFGSRSEKVARRITQTEAQLTAMQQQRAARTGRIDAPPVPRPLRQTHTRKPFSE